MTLINPYNFVSLGAGGPERNSGAPAMARFQNAGYSGLLECRLIVESPLMTLDQRNPSKHTLRDNAGNPCKRSNGIQWNDIKVFKFLRNSREKPMLQGTSIKGMIRSVYEALTDSCLTLAAPTGTSSKGGRKPYCYDPLGDYENIKCNALEALCPACRLFGTIEGDMVHWQGRVSVSDAVLAEGTLKEKRLYLKELSSPKPQHRPTYGKNGQASGPIAGRKFYYHQGASPVFTVSKQCDSSDRSIGIEEYAPVDNEFSFQVQVDNLDQKELGKLLLAMELDEGLGHKLGLGKALGMGSCRVVIDLEESLIMKSEDRYKSWQAEEGADFYSFKAGRNELPKSLVEILRFNKVEDGTICYPDITHYPTDPIDALGVFGGKAKRGGRPPWAEAAAASKPKESAPKVGPDQQAAWLKEIREDHLVFVTEEGQEIERERSAHQGKDSALEVEKWFILWGDNASRRA